MLRSKDVQINENVTFENLVRKPELLRGLESAGYERPSPIQLQAIPLGRLGVDLVAQAKSGTGKTVVFGTIALESLDMRSRVPQVLIVAPTREIAVQIRDVLRDLGKYIQEFRCEALIGGLATSVDTQKAKGCQILVGTPGRLMAHLHSKTLNVRHIKLLVLDEADKLMSDAFRQQTLYIHRKLPQGKQCMAFSATFTEEFLKSLEKVTKDAQIVRLTTEIPELEEVQQYYKEMHVDIPEDVDEFKAKLVVYKSKFEAAAELLSSIPFYQCIIFLNSVPRAFELSKWLTENGWMSGCISSSLTQEQRLKVMEKMRDFKLRVLVCSDLIARGIDIDRVNLVINMDFPRDIDTYMHRVGRTGRYGTSGIAVNLVGPDDQDFLKELKKKRIKMLPLPENVKYSEFRRILSENEEKVFKKHQSQRESKGDRPLQYTKMDKKIEKAAKPKKRVTFSEDVHIIEDKSPQYTDMDEKIEQRTMPKKRKFPAEDADINEQEQVVKKRKEESDSHTRPASRLTNPPRPPRFPLPPRSAYHPYYHYPTAYMADPNYHRRYRSYYPFPFSHFPIPPAQFIFPNARSLRPFIPPDLHF